MTSLTFITDPLVTTMGAVRPTILLARELRKKGNRLTVITPRSDEGIAKSLQAEGIKVKNVGPRFSLISSFPTLDAWARSLIKTKRLDRTDGVIVNTSSCIVAPAHVYYAQGLMTRTLTEILSANASIYGCIYALLKRPLVRLEQKLTHQFRDSSDLFIANSRFCASMYEEWGIKVDKTINPPVDCTFYKSSTRNPSEDYIITALGAFGKEGNFKLVKAIADAGACIKVFGEAAYVPGPMKKNPNIEFLGKVSDQELVQLYSNALFTLFAFGHEPFGYIPVESMACGTPVLTFNRQGPSETVIDRRTGWLADSDQDLLALALYHWSKGYDSAFRLACRERAMIFDTKWILRQWNRIIQEGVTRKSG